MIPRIILLCQMLLFQLIFSGHLYSQIADFEMNDSVGCNPHTVIFTNTGSIGVQYSYYWDFGDESNSNNENPTHTYANPNPNSELGDYEVTLTVTNTNTLISKSKTKNVFVKLTPSAKLDIDTSNACINGDVVFITGFDSKDSTFWDFGDGIVIKSKFEDVSEYVFHSYKTNGNYNIGFITYLDECSDTSNYSFNVKGPITGFTTSKNEACIDESIKYLINKNSTGISSFYWDFGNGNTFNTDSVFYSYDTSGYYVTKLHVSGPSGSCIIDDTVHIVGLQAGFSFTDNRFCHEQLINIQNASIGNDYNYWDFGNGNTGTGSNSAQTYPTGNYTIKLIVSNDIGCSDSIQKEIQVNELPTLQFNFDTITICKGSSSDLLANSNAQKIEWYPATSLNNPNIFNPVASPEVTTTYFITVTDTNTNCRQFGQMLLKVQEQIATDNIYVYPTDTSIFAGDTVKIITIDDDSLSRNLNFSWSPSDYVINCTNCKNPIVQPLHNSTYILEITDPYSCFTPKQLEVVINVTEKYIIGVPDAFTPNNDGINDIIKVDGKGIKKLIEFRVFNRWGTEVFYTDDMNTGWDGYYKNNLQGIDTYTYIIKAEMFDDASITKKGTFSLIR